MAPKPKQYLVVMLGAAEVGKTALVNQFCEQGFFEEHEPTIYDDFYVPSHRLQIVDVGNDYLRTDNAFLRRADGFVIVYDIGSLASFEKARQIFAEVQESSNPATVLVGNKVDDERRRQVSLQDGRRLARERKSTFCEVTAKSNAGTRGVFDAIFRLLEQQHANTETAETLESDQEPEGKGLASFFLGCCRRG